MMTSETSETIGRREDAPAERRRNPRANDLGFLALLALLCLALSWAPYLYGYAAAPRDACFTGLVGRDVPGAYMYLMWERQALDGAHLFENRLTPERHEPFYFNPEWWLLGKALRLSSLPLTAGFHVERTVTVILLVFGLYYLAARFFTDPRERRWALILMLFATGLGWVPYALEHSGLSVPDLRLWDIQGINLFGYLINKPHFVRAILGTCIAMAFLLRGEETGRRRFFLFSGLTASLTAAVRPYDLPLLLMVYALVPALLSLQERTVSPRRTGHYLTALAGTLPAVAYYLYLRYGTIMDRVWKGVELEPLSPLELLLWLGIPFLTGGFCFGGFRHLHRNTREGILLSLWAAALLVLIYAYPLVPWGMESAGTFYVLSALACCVCVFRHAAPALQARLARSSKGRFTAHGVMIGILLLSLPSNIILYANLFEDLSRHARPYYLPRALMDGFDWLDRHSQPSDIVLAAAENGCCLPVYGGVKAFTGHYHFTIDFSGKNALVKRFFDECEEDEFRRDLLERYAVRYVLYSDTEKHLGRFDPGGADYLQAVYRNEQLTLYEVSEDIRVRGDEPGAQSGSRSQEDRS
ncbi:conserved membrane hypothetical protein [uncultured Desulfatiglans sp.]|nr:conserved membrane hypothetical protein [uncultured Desulfatiglans sp.]